VSKTKVVRPLTSSFPLGKVTSLITPIQSEWTETHTNMLFCTDMYPATVLFRTCEHRRRFCPRACLVTSVYFKSPTVWCSRGMCDSRLEKDFREIGAPQTTAPSTIPRQRQWASAVCGQDPASSATFRPIRDQSEYTVLGGPARALFWLLRGDSCSL